MNQAESISENISGAPDYLKTACMSSKQNAVRNTINYHTE